MNKPEYLGQAILDLTKTQMYKFHYDYMQPKYESKAKSCYMDTDSFAYKMETEHYNRHVAKGVETNFETSGYLNDANRPLPIGKNKKVIPVMKYKVGGEIISKFVALRAKIYAYRNLDCLAAQHEPKKLEDKHCKGTEMSVVAKSLTFDDYKACFFKGKTTYREQILFENEKHVV